MLVLLYLIFFNYLVVVSDWVFIDDDKSSFKPKKAYIVTLLIYSMYNEL